MSYKIEYYNGKTHLETFYKPNLILARWLVKELKLKGYVGTFKIIKENYKNRYIKGFKIFKS